MCGIAGSFRKTDPIHVEKMLDKLMHRGPDGHGMVELPNAVLGHTRLAILDVEGGVQPMQVDHTWITFNGEIYNYRDLSKRFLPGQLFRTHSDTEVLLNLYRLMGPAMVDHLDGMFAFGIWQEGELFLARDPLGIKPLYWGEKDGVVYFASEIKAISLAVDEIHEFPPGHWYHSRHGWRCYIKISDPVIPFLGTRANACVAVFEVLTKAVQKRLLADVPVGISLSGGLDSSIVAMLASQGTDQLNSYAVGMEASEDLAAARKMASVIRTRHHERVYTEGEMIAVLPDVIYALESFDPALVRSAIPNYFLAELASKTVKVILTGEGADELFAGYDYMCRFDEETALQKEMVHITTALHNTNLQRADRVAMAFGLEARVPFLDIAAVELFLRFPPVWKIHRTSVPKALLRQAFLPHLPQEIVNRPKQKFSKGAGSSDILEAIADRDISDQDFQSEQYRLLQEWNYRLENKEGLFYYRILQEHYADQWIFPTMGLSRSL